MMPPITTVAASTHSSNPDRVRAALSHVNPHDRALWVKMAFAIKSELGEEGLDIWSDWGSQHERPASEVRATWKSADEFGKVGIGSLFYEAKQAGWKDDKKFAEPSAAEIALREKERTARQAAAAAREAEKRAQAAVEAARLWANAEVATEDHPYLTRKAVKAHGLRVADWEVRILDPESGEILTRVYKDCLLVPIRDRKNGLHSLQAITPEGKKLYLTGGGKRGHFHPIGGKPKTNAAGNPIYVLAEGFATAASVHECTGHLVLCCFDAGNIAAVAKDLREAKPEAVIVIAADNDIETESNPGVTTARKAAEAVGGVVAVPVLSGMPEKSVDYNDLHAIEGAAAVLACIEVALSARDTGDTILPVWLVPPTDPADLRRAAFAADLLAMFDDAVAQRLDPRGVVLCQHDGSAAGLRAALKEVRRLMPRATCHAIVSGAMQADAAKIPGLSMEVLPPDTSWVDDLWAAVTARTGLAESEVVDLSNTDPAAREIGEQATSSRDEERRRQQQEENRRLQEVDLGAMIPSQLTIDEMLSHCVFIADKRFVAFVTEDRSMFLKADDFQVLTAASKTEIEVMQRGKPVTKLVANASLWISDLRRVDAMTATFHAGAPTITVNPKGLRAVNTWRPIKRWPSKADVGPFLEQVRYLFSDPVERRVFLDFLAHIEQKPGELPHYGWLHIAENTGTGRNWMASVLARVFRGYTAPNVDLAALLDSQYNGELGGCVLAIVDEVQEGASEGNYQHAQRLKSMVNAEMRTVNNKYGLKYLEYNALRWLVFSNHKNALPLNDSDRRFRVVMHKAPPRPPEVYDHLYALLKDPEFINAIGMFLRNRDISGFKPGERPPLNADKLAAIAASKPMSTQGAEEIVSAWPADVITNKHVVELLTGVTGGTEKKEFTPAMRRAMEEAGAHQWIQGKVQKIKIDGASHRVWVLRDHTKWLTESTDAVRKELLRAGVDDSLGKPASVILADAAEEIERIREPPI